MRRARRKKLDSGIIAVVFSIAAATLTVGVTAFAQNWTPAPANAPQGNVAGPIWNAKVSGVQQDADIDITGGINANAIGTNDYGPDPAIGIVGRNARFGTFAGGFVVLGLNSGAGTTDGQLVATGHAAFGGYAPDATKDLTLKNMYIGVPGTGTTIIGEDAGLGTGPGDIYTDGTLVLPSGAAAGLVLTSDASGNASWQPVGGAGVACSANVFDHLTPATYAGNLGSYQAANAACGAGAHICTPDELLATVRCAPATLPASGNGWVANGPPGFTSPAANDCAGWSSNAASSYGTFWQFSGTTGGKGFATSCNLALNIACCK